jgi:hypothetical protein
MNEFLIGFLILASLLLIALGNNHVNMKRHKSRRHRNFGENYQRKRKDKNCSE